MELNSAIVFPPFFFSNVQMSLFGVSCNQEFCWQASAFCLLMNSLVYIVAQISNGERRGTERSWWNKLSASL